LCSFTELFAEEYKNSSIAMNCLCLGSVQTEMLEEALDELKPSYQDQIKNAIDHIVEMHGVEAPITVPSAGKMIMEYMGIEKAIELFEGAQKEASGDMFKSSAYKVTLETILK
jgi:short-subunit dehydrogenase